ncbi:MAG: ATP-binding cassette domain-containing protein, partial [Halieaceae bacterium]|nr:ATP-binding cassette domain-containing protein [Halieaceae bacterium]
MTLALKLTNVGMRFAMNSGGEKGHFQALSELDLEVYRGDKLGLIGGNGAGKSTLLRIMAGIYPPGSGTVWRAPGL